MYQLSLVQLYRILFVPPGYTKPESLDPRLINPLVENLIPCLPTKIRDFFRFGIVHEGVSKTQIQLFACHRYIYFTHSQFFYALLQGQALYRSNMSFNQCIWWLVIKIFLLELGSSPWNYPFTS